jgi:hypothetical protein
VKALLSTKGVILVCAIIAGLFLVTAAMTYDSENPSWRLWVAGAIPFALVVPLIIIARGIWALIIITVRGIDALAWHLAGKVENVKLPAINTSPSHAPHPKLKTFSLILKWIAGGLVIMGSIFGITSALLQGAMLIGAVLAGVIFGFSAFIGTLPLLILALLIDVADLLNQNAGKTQVQNEKLMELLEQQQRRIEQLEQARNP